MYQTRSRPGTRFASHLACVDQPLSLRIFLGVDSPFFSAIVLFENQPFPQMFLVFYQNPDPWVKNGNGSYP